MPQGVTAVVQRRLAMLPPKAHRVLAVAAVIGPEFSREVLVQVLEPELRTAPLNEALGSNIVTEVPDGSTKKPRQSGEFNRCIGGDKALQFDQRIVNLFGFFFYLDIISTASLLFDIGWFSNWVFPTADSTSIVPIL